MRFSVPLRVKVSKNKYFVLNLNQYRNAHHHILNTAKRNFTDIVLNLDLPRKQYNQVKIHYKIYPKSKRLYDGMNVVSIIDKFTCDALIKRGVLPDDNIKHVQSVSWEACPPDKDNPRAEIEIINLDTSKIAAWIKRIYG